METDKKQFSVRPPSDVHERLAEAAAWTGQTLHAFVLGAAAREADAVLTNRDRIRITPAYAEKIIQLLDNPPEPNDALMEAFRRRAEILSE